MKTRNAILLLLLSHGMWVSQALAQQGPVVHRLKIVVGSGFLFTNDDADTIIAEMNRDIENASPSWSSWDDSCPQVKFERDGKVIVVANLASSGDFVDLSANVQAAAPQANVYVVSNVICAGSAASGCSTIGSEPAVVTSVYGLQTDAVIWLHERGHDMGLSHTGYDGYPAEDTPVSVGHRIMFWQPGSDHTGKLSDECQAFSNPRFASVGTAASGLASANHPATPAVNSGAAHAPAAAALPEEKGASTDAPSGTQVPKTASPEDQAKAAGLTLPAYKVVSTISGDDGSFAKAIEGLSGDDVDSIRNFVRSPKSGPSQFRLQALKILGQRGGPDDVALLRGVLDQPVAAAPPGHLTFDQREQIRLNLAEKDAAVHGLGSLAKSTQSIEAVEALKKNVDLTKATSTVGKEYAKELSWGSLRALTTTPEGAGYVSKILESTTPTSVQQKGQKVKVEDAKTILAPPLDQAFRNQLQSSIELLKTS